MIRDGAPCPARYRDIAGDRRVDLPRSSPMAGTLHASTTRAKETPSPFLRAFDSPLPPLLGILVGGALKEDADRCRLKYSPYQRGCLADKFAQKPRHMPGLCPAWHLRLRSKRRMIDSKDPARHSGWSARSGRGGADRATRRIRANASRGETRPPPEHPNAIADHFLTYGAPRQPPCRLTASRHRELG